MIDPKELVEAFAAMSADQRDAVLGTLSPRASADKIVAALKSQLARLDEGMAKINSELIARLKAAESGDLSVIGLSDGEVSEYLGISGK